jgi:hypothetical protein
MKTAGQVASKKIVIHYAESILDGFPGYAYESPLANTFPHTSSSLADGLIKPTRTTSKSAHAHWRFEVGVLDVGLA